MSPDPRKPRRGASKEGIRALLGSSPGREVAPKVEKAEAGVREGEDLVERAVDEAIRSPRVTVHSPLVSAVMRYLKMSRGLSISTTLREVLEEAVKERFPEEADLVGRALLSRKERELRRRLGIE